ncbi:hypothetical protein O181_042068 [Austropuccinia psidii MF-1]|uniref:Uncharacterized protein n=1 Tax=Austropuccinia psidii MF-1 TaxID=1389203 RepID=A0A9Q3DIM2_9BASI|nr:hypothetical protein [Austropuccinia psidii MF-1]
MPIQHSPPARKTRSQARTQSVLTPTPRAPLDGTPAEEENSVEEEGYDGSEDVPAPVGAYQGTEGPNLAQSNQPEPSLLAILQQMTQIRANLQAASSSEESRPAAFKTPSMKAQNALMGLNPSKLEVSFSIVN